MSASNILPEKGFKATIAGKEYHFRFTTRIFCELAEKYGIITGAFDVLSKMDTNNFGVKELEDLAFIIHMALKKEHPEITMDYVMDEIDIAEITDMIEPMLEAFKSAMQAREKVKGTKKSPPVTA
jgi:hypothetical protein